MEKAGCSSGTKLLFIFWLLAPLLIYQVDYNGGNGHFTLCLFKNITGMDCYGCGVVRGVSACLHLDFAIAYQLNHVNLITIPLLTYLYLKELWRTRPNGF